MFNFDKIYRKKQFILGSVLIFLSWITQNYLNSSWSSDKLFHERAQMNRLVEELNMNVWTSTLLVESSKEKPSKDVLVTATFKLILHSLSLMAWQTTPFVSDGNAAFKVIQEKETLENKARKYFESGDLRNLMDMQHTLASQMNNAAFYSRDRISDEHQQLLVKVDFSSKLFMLMYIIGSIFIALSYVPKTHNKGTTKRRVTKAAKNIRRKRRKQTLTRA